MILVEAARAGIYELTPTGERVPIKNGDVRFALSLVDVKHAQEANPSYEAEVVLYGLLLANWLLNNGYDDCFFVTA